MSLAVGDHLGPYTIKGLLGSGGMGEVYRGTDARLGRDVALKVISARLVGDAEHRRRFEVEARAASALSHPGIVTIYDVGETGGVSWIAMEWVDGHTLRRALADRPLPVREAWSITRQVAHALAAAHAKGIVHRDLKPDNVMLAAEGQAKILDFGLARQTLVDSLEGSASATRTAVPREGTVEGAILGTVGYMSPEQASGRSADYRSDQFSLGLLAYEMLAGRRAFAKDSAVETLSAIIREDPVPVASLRDGVPEGFLRVIDRCLAKRPAERFESTRDLVTALDVAGSDATPPPAARIRRLRLAPAAWAALAGAALVGLALAVWNGTGSAPSAAIDSLAVLPFENVNPDPGTEYLGDGLSESLIAKMSRVQSLRVMAHGTVARFKGTSNPQQAGQELRVGAVLTGRVSRQGSQLVIGAELINTRTGERLWGARFDRPAADLLSVQDSIATQIADALHLQLSGAERQTLGSSSTTDSAAYELFLKARYLMGGDTEEDDIEAARLLQLAIEKDPRFVEAYLALAGVHARTAGNGFAPPAEAFARSTATLQQVLKIDPDNVAAQSSLVGQRFLSHWDWSLEKEFRALSNDPRTYHTLQYHGITLYFWAIGRADESVAITERALRVDPGNVETRVMRADFLAHAGRLDESLRAYQEIAAADPSDARPWFGLAEVLKRRGDIKGAIEAARKAYELSDEDYGVRALAKATTERDFDNAERAVARVRLEDQKALARERYVSPLELARLHAMAGDREQALKGLEAALAERSPNLLFLKVDRGWDSVRDDPRFAAIVRKVGIP